MMIDGASEGKFDQNRATGGVAAKIIEQAYRMAKRLATVLGYAAALLLLLMMLLTCFNVIVRSLPDGLALVGIYEITGYLASAVVAFAIAYTQLSAGHIAIDWIVIRLPEHARAVIKSVALLLSTGLFVLIAWHSYRFAADLWLKGEVSPTQKIPFYPFVFGVALGCAAVALLLIVDFFKTLTRAAHQ
jgi:TRAP-type C4-dicarboxylate transport system permease small subunit